MRGFHTRAVIVAIVVAVSCAVPAAANATTLFSNINGFPSVSSGINEATAASNSWVAKEFTPTASGTAGIISFWATCSSGGTCNPNGGSTSGTIQLYTDSGGAPGTALGQPTTFSAPAFTGNDPICVATSSSPSLTQNTPYWAVMKTASSGDDIGWLFQDSSGGTVRDSADNGASWGTSLVTQGDLSLRIETGSTCTAHMVPNPTDGTTVGGMFPRSGKHSFDTITIGNDGIATLNLTSYTITETDSTGQTPFTLLDGQPDANPPGTTYPQSSQVLPGGTAILYTTCTGPTQEGHYTATLTLHTNDTTQPSISWPLSCYVDNTPPVFSPINIPTPDGNNGWFKTNPVKNISVSADDGVNGSGTNNITCTDNGAQILNVAAGGGFLDASNEGDNALSCTASDVAGNVTPTPTTGDLKIDSRPPVISPTVTPTPNNAGWNNSSATVGFSCADPTPGSGIDTNTVGGGGNFIAETAGTVVSSTGTCTDIAGNTGSSSSVTVKIDETPPTTELSGGPPARTNSASASGFVLGGNDALSGVVGFQCSLDGATPTSCSTQNPPTYSNLTVGQTHTLTVQAIDAAGNIDHTGASTSWFVDQTPPTVAFDSPAANATVTGSGQISFHATDPDDNSGFAFMCQVDTGPKTQCTSPYSYTGLSASTNPHVFKVTATDPATNQDTEILSFNVADPPSVAIDAPADGAIYSLGQAVNASYSCSEGTAGPGIDTCTDNQGVGNGNPIDTSTPGVFSFKVTATSTDGQSFDKTVSYTVAAAPSVTITAPADGGTYSVGQTVDASYSCTDGSHGPGIDTCTDDHGIGNGNPIHTSTPGTFSLKVTATSTDGQSTDKTVNYTVAASPTLSVSAPSSGTAGSAISGSDVSATLLSGASPTGTVTFRVFGPQSSAPSDCAGGTSVGTASVSGNGSYSPGTGFKPTEAGDYWWYASYAGDSLNNAANSACDQSMAETVVGPASPSLSVFAPPSGTAGSAIPGSVVSARLSGGVSPSGAVTFRVFGPRSSAPSDCSGGTKVGTAAVSGNGAYDSSAGFTPSQAGDYWWYASYGGDSNNNHAASRCGGSMSKTVVKPAESTLKIDRVSASGLSARVLLECQGNGANGCEGTLTIQTTDPSASSDKVIVGRAEATLTNGQSMTVELELNRTGQRLLKKRGRLQTKLLVTQSGNVVAHMIITFQRT